MVVEVEKVRPGASLLCVKLNCILRVQSAEGLVTTLDESRHNLEDGDYVTFSEIKGMEELNGCEPRKVTVKGASSSIK